MEISILISTNKNIINEYFLVFLFQYKKNRKTQISEFFSQLVFIFYIPSWCNFFLVNLLILVKYFIDPLLTPNKHYLSI